MKTRIRKTGTSFMAMLIAVTLSLYVVTPAFAQSDETSDTGIEFTQSSGDEDSDTACDAVSASSTTGDGASDALEGELGQSADETMQLFDEEAEFTQVDGIWSTPLITAPEFDGTLSLGEGQDSYALVDAAGNECASVKGGEQFRILFVGEEIPSSAFGEYFDLHFDITATDGAIQSIDLSCMAIQSTGSESSTSDEDASSESDEESSSQSTATEASHAKSSSASSSGSTSSDSSTTTSSTSTSSKSSKSSSSKSKSSSHSSSSQATHDGTSGKSKSGSGKSKSHSSKDSSDADDDDANDKSKGKSGEQSDEKGGKNAKEGSADADDEESTDEEDAEGEETDEAGVSADEKSFNTTQAASLAVLSSGIAAAGLYSALKSRKR